MAETESFCPHAVHNNQHTKILTISHRQVHHTDDIENEKNKKST